MIRVNGAPGAVAPASSVGCPALLPDQRHEADIGEVLALVFVLGDARDADELLDLRIAPDRDDQAAADLELLLQRFRNFRPAGGDNDGVDRAHAPASPFVPSPCSTCTLS